jgi:hypothetical protein
MKIEQKLNRDESRALLLIEGIEEDFLTKRFLKFRQEYIQEKGEKRKEGFTFYVSIYFGQKMIKSRTVNSQQENYPLPQTQEAHNTFFEKKKSKKKGIKEPIYFYTEKDGKDYFCLLEIGDLAIVVSDSLRLQTEVFCGLIGITYAINKAFYSDKQWGQYCDLKKYFQSRHEQIWEILNDIDQIMSGMRGGYKPNL